MNPQEFIEAIKIAVLDHGVKAVHSMLIDPPGRKPAEKFVELAIWFDDLDEKTKANVLRVVQNSESN